MWSCMHFSIVPSRWLQSGWPVHLGVESRHCGKNTALPSDCSLPLVWFNGLYSWCCAASVPTNFQAMISWLWGMIAFLKKHKACATLVTQRSRYMWRQLFPSRWKVAVMWQSCLISWWRARHRHRWQPKSVTSSSAMSFQRRAPNSLQLWRPQAVCKPSCAPWMHTCPARKCRNKLCGAWRIWDWTDRKTKRHWWRWEALRLFWGPWRSTAAMKRCKRKAAWRWLNWPRNTRTSWGFWVLEQIRSFWMPCETTQPALVCNGGLFKPSEIWPRPAREEPSCVNTWQLTSSTLPWETATLRSKRKANSFLKSWRRVATQGHEMWRCFAVQKLLQCAKIGAHWAGVGSGGYLAFLGFHVWLREPCRNNLLLEWTGPPLISGGQ